MDANKDTTAQMQTVPETIESNDPNSKEFLTFPPLDTSLPDKLPRGTRIVQGCRAHIPRLKSFFTENQGRSNNEFVPSPAHVDHWFDKEAPALYVLERFADANATPDALPGLPASHPMVGLIYFDQPSERDPYCLDIYTTTDSSDAVIDFLSAYGAYKARLSRVIGYTRRILILGPSPSVSKIDWIPSPRDPGNLVLRDAHPVYSIPPLVAMWKKIGWGWQDVPSWMTRFEQGVKAVWMVTPGQDPSDCVCSMALSFVDGEGDRDMVDLSVGLISLSHFGVDPPRQAKGIGNWMMQFLHGEVKMMGYKKIGLNTDPRNHGWKLYEKCGYKFVKKEARDWTIKEMTDKPMEERVAWFYQRDL